MKLHNLQITDKQGCFLFLLDDKQINGILSYEIKVNNPNANTILKLELEVGDIEYGTAKDNKKCENCCHYAGTHCGDIQCSLRAITSELIWGQGCPSYKKR